MNSMKTFVFNKLTNVSPTRGFVFLVGLVSLMWGLWVVNPQVESLSNPIFNPLMQIASEWVWACFFIIVGLIKIIAVLTRNSKAIRFATFMGTMLWFALATFLIVEEWKVTGVVTYYGLSIMNAWAYLQVRFHPEIISGNKILPQGWQTPKKAKKRENDA